MVAKVDKNKEMEDNVKRLKHKHHYIKFDLKHNRKMASFMANDPNYTWRSMESGPNGLQTMKKTL